MSLFEDCVRKAAAIAPDAYVSYSRTTAYVTWGRHEDNQPAWMDNAGTLCFQIEELPGGATVRCRASFGPWGATQPTLCTTCRWIDEVLLRHVACLSVYLLSSGEPAKLLPQALHAWKCILGVEGALAMHKEDVAKGDGVVHFPTTKQPEHRTVILGGNND